MSDELAIRNLVSRLAVLADSGDLEDYLGEYTEDAVWEMPAVGQLPGDHRQGRAAIAASVRSRRDMGVQGPGTGTQHHVTTGVIDIDGDEATGHLYYQFVKSGDAGPVIQTVGAYRDRYRRTPEGWKLAHRTILLNGSPVGS